MNLLPTRRPSLLALVLGVGLLTATACGSSSDPLATGTTTPPSATSAPAVSSDADTSSTPGGNSSGSSGSGGSATGSSSGGQTVVIGSADFTESVIIADIYAGALKAKGITVTLKPRIGSREIYMPALADSSISLIPEYTGTALQYFDKSATASDEDSTYAALQKAVPEGVEALDKASAQDKDSLTVTQQTASSLNLKTIEDLQGKSQDMVIGGPKEWQTRPTGIPGFEKVYGLKFKSFEETDAGGPLTIKALTSGIIQAGNVFTTDAAIKKNNLVALEDTKNLFGAQNVVPLITTAAATPEVKDALNAVQAKLTTDGLITLNDQVANQDMTEEQAAAGWLKENGLG